MRPKGAVLRDVLQAGVRAPTADNRPVVRLRLVAHGVELWAEAAEEVPPARHRRAFALLAAGAMVENMALRSAAHGLVLQAAPLPDAARPDLFGRLQWREAGATQVWPDAEAALDQAIERRHTNRRFFRRSRIDPRALQAVVDAAVDVPGTSLQWLEGPARQQAVRAIRRAEAERFRRRALHEELFGAIRFDVGWHRGADEGLPPAALEVEPPLRLGFGWLRHWPVMRAAGWLGVPALLGWRAGGWPCATAPRLGLLSARADLGEVGWWQAGRAFERLWLAAQSQGLALQPMAATVALAVQAAGGGWVSPALQASLRSDLQRWVPAGWQPTMLFRLGVATIPRVVTGRRLLERYIDPAGESLPPEANAQPNQALESFSTPVPPLA